MCGEQLPAHPRTYVQGGSPPRVRGTVLNFWIPDEMRRITPACAGNRSQKGWHGRCAQDHPRVCGEQPSTRAIFAHTNGSPPRVRGTGPFESTAFSCKRITPACAGNRLKARVCDKLSKDHPRVCGEQVRILLSFHPPAGSPPRVRGTAIPIPRPFCLDGITPACAGNSW